jgi:hypothetical protein
MPPYLRLAALGALALGLTGCGAKPQQAVGVSAGPTIHYLLCDGDRVTAVRLTTPGGRVLWQRTFAPGTTRTTFRVPISPRLPARVSGPDGKPAMQLVALPTAGLVRGDGRRMTAARFESGRDGYCGAARQDRAAALAVGFAFLVLAAVFAGRWLCARRSRDPYDRAYR